MFFWIHTLICHLQQSCEVESKVSFLNSVLRIRKPRLSEVKEESSSWQVIGPGSFYTLCLSNYVEWITSIPEVALARVGREKERQYMCPCNSSMSFISKSFLLFGCWCMNAAF